MKKLTHAFLWIAILLVLLHFLPEISGLDLNLLLRGSTTKDNQ